MKWCFEGCVLQDPFSDHNKISMANATIDALYADSLRLKKYHISYLNNFTFYKWCVTKVAHCIYLTNWQFPSFRNFLILFIHNGGTLTI